MLLKFVIMAAAFGAIAADPVEKRTFSSSNDVTYVEYPGYELVSHPDVSSIINAICSLIGYKFTALSLAVSAIHWLVSNFSVVIFGAITAFSFCKITGKCGLNYEEYIPVTQLQGLVTPENIETAEKFFITAVEKYAEEKKRSV